MVNRDSEEAISISERRASDRKKLIVDVHFNGGETTGIANTRDIGIGGLYVTTKTLFDVGTPIFMRMTLSGKEVQLNGVVVYSDPGKGVGVRFHDLTGDAEDLLKRELELE